MTTPTAITISINFPIWNGPNNQNMAKGEFLNSKALLDGAILLQNRLILYLSS